jgi:HK97 family phage portal protein
MRVLGLEISRAKAAAPAPVDSGRGGWVSVIRESFAGAWQRNVEISRDSVLSFHAVYACATRIASDVAKLRVKLVQQDVRGIWAEVSNPAYSPVLRKPNAAQNRIQFWETWILSKLLHGNAYVLKRRDGRGVVTALYVLDPTLVRALVAEDGSVFYEIQPDNIAGVTETIVAPAREIIHDRWNTIFHPLVGGSPIYACGLAATQGLRIQESSTRFFANDSKPGGILTAPGKISNETAERLKAAWEQNYGGANTGRVAVLGDGLKYERTAVTATDAQLIEQLKWTAEVVCSCFHVPPYKIGIGPAPAYNNIQALNVEYYAQCLQVLIEAAEVCLDEGLEMAPGIGTEFDLDGLLRMDSLAQIQVLKEAVGSKIMHPNEARKKIDLQPSAGGDALYGQQQDYSLEALAKRDARPDPFAPASAGAVSEPAAQDDAAVASEARAALVEIYKGLA